MAINPAMREAMLRRAALEERRPAAPPPMVPEEIDILVMLNGIVDTLTLMHDTALFPEEEKPTLRSIIDDLEALIGRLTPGREAAPPTPRVPLPEERT